MTSSHPFDPAEFDALDPSEMDLGPTPRPDALRFLLTRRSTPAKTLIGPAPDEATLQLLLRAATRVPDHGKLTPWRFILIRGDAQERLGRAAAARAAALDLDEAAIEKARAAFQMGPLIVAVVAAPVAHPKIPESEQLASAAVVCASLVNAALAAGHGANWLTGWMAHDAEFGAAALGLAPHERIAGFVHLGAPKTSPPERPRPDLATLVTEAPT